jgi:hypothetical protein
MTDAGTGMRAYHTAGFRGNNPWLMEPAADTGVEAQSSVAIILNARGVMGTAHQGLLLGVYRS